MRWRLRRRRCRHLSAAFVAARLRASLFLCALVLLLFSFSPHLAATQPRSDPPRGEENQGCGSLHAYLSVRKFPLSASLLHPSSSSTEVSAVHATAIAAVRRHPSIPLSGVCFIVSVEREREREREPQMPRPTLFRPDVNEQASERGRTYLLARVCVSWMDTRRNDGGGCAPIKHLPPLQALQPS